MGIQRNKLGITDFAKLEKIEKSLVKYKLDILDSDFTFEQDNYGVDYLQQLHNFLFGDLYYEEDLSFRSNYTSEQLEQVDTVLKQLGIRSMNQEIGCEELSIFFQDLWEAQLFHDGNARTLWAFLAMNIEAFQLPMELCMKTDELLLSGDVKPYKAFQLVNKKKSQ